MVSHRLPRRLPSANSSGEQLGRRASSEDAGRGGSPRLFEFADCVLRDRDTNSNGTLDERLYACQDANWNVTALVNPTGTVQERFAYSAYGVPMVLDASFTPRLPITGLPTSVFDWETLYCGYRFEATNALYHIRHRVYHPGVGVWVQRDPLGYPDGPNTYAAWFVPNSTDPYGYEKIDFALNAFIGNVRPGGPWFNEPPGTPFAQFKGDDRAFNTAGTSRVRSEGSIDSCSMKFSGLRNVAGASHRRTWGLPSLPCNLNPGWVYATRTAPLATDIVDSPLNSKLCANSVHFLVAASYPFSSVAPQINIRSDFQFSANSDTVTVAVAGVHDAFPDYELIVDGKLIYKYLSPYNGPGFTSLMETVAFVATTSVKRTTSCHCAGTCK